MKDNGNERKRERGKGKKKNIAFIWMERRDNKDEKKPGLASSVEDRLLRNMFSSSDRGSNLAVRQVFFRSRMH